MSEREGQRRPSSGARAGAGIRQAQLFQQAARPDDRKGERRPPMPPDAPLAHRMRPRTLDEVVGQESVTDPAGALRRGLAQGELPSLILWGPPGSGKTTLAYLLAEAWGARLVSLSAVTSGVADVRRAVEEAEAQRAQGVRTVLFIDEIHRFSRAQQDSILPHVETGRVRLIGATTENPSFSLTAALLSRCQVVHLDPLSPQAVRTVLERALHDSERGLGGRGLVVPEDAMDALVGLSQGDARAALNALEAAQAGLVPDATGKRILTLDAVRQAFLTPRVLYHDRAGDLHYDLASALIKSIRGSDPDASVYWLARLLEAGEDPMFVARRLVLSAAEDVGLADPLALPVAVAALSAVHAIGMPEGYLPLTEATLYLAVAPKSNSGLRAYERAKERVHARPDLPVPLHLRNAPTELMRTLGYGAVYRYPHDTPEHLVPQTYLPDALVGTRLYEPGTLGVEGTWRERIEEVRRVLAQAVQPAAPGAGDADDAGGTGRVRDGEGRR